MRRLNPQRLSKVIQNRESQKTTNYLLEVYDSLLPSQREEIRKLFLKNSKINVLKKCQD